MPNKNARTKINFVGHFIFYKNNCLKNYQYISKSNIEGDSFLFFKLYIINIFLIAINNYLLSLYFF